MYVHIDEAMTKVEILKICCNDHQWMREPTHFIFD